jgi:hypothetical protein
MIYWKKFNAQKKKFETTGKVSDPESLSFYVGFDTPGRLTPKTTGS